MSDKFVLVKISVTPGAGVLCHMTPFRVRVTVLLSQRVEPYPGQNLLLVYTACAALGTTKAFIII